MISDASTFGGLFPDDLDFEIELMARVGLSPYLVCEVQDPSRAAAASFRELAFGFSVPRVGEILHPRGGGVREVLSVEHLRVDDPTGGGAGVTIAMLICGPVRAAIAASS